jgi:hypothetical protein
VDHLDSNACGCGEDEDDGKTAEHILFHCPKWNSLWQVMRTATGAIYRDISFV